MVHLALQRYGKYSHKIRFRSLEKFQRFSKVIRAISVICLIHTINQKSINFREFRVSLTFSPQQQFLLSLKGK